MANSDERAYYMKTSSNPTPCPPCRRLKVFSLDPSADVQLENSLISRSVVQVPWEELGPGPVGEYIEVVDVDPSTGCAYDPVDLDNPHLLAQDGLSPSTGNPQFHQQMAYAVAMKTIANFEKALGRKILWVERRHDEKGSFISDPDRRYIRRLRVYPHALREQNAYYSPSKGAILFGYFNAPTTDPRDELPGGLVFTCLSHDIIAHEMTHAILDGMHRRLLEISNPDMIALHEAFADIVAIFQHFTLPGLLLDQIQKTRGNLRTNNLLARLASQFARATGQGDALRNALGEFRPDGTRKPPDPAVLSRTFEPHERGAIFVAAVFDAFVKIYENRIADLRRIATGGTGVLPAGDIHPDLARRFADEAVRIAQRILNICIRTLDYLPPVDVTFGDFLRGLITADADLFPEDPTRYRLAFIEAFRDRGIYPLDVRALAEDALRWTPLDPGVWQRLKDILPPPAVLRTMTEMLDASQMQNLLGPALEIDDLSMIKGGVWDLFRENRFKEAADAFLAAAWRPESGQPDLSMDERGQRYPRYYVEHLMARFLHGWIRSSASSIATLGQNDDLVGWHFGLDVKSLSGLQRSGPRPFEVHAVRPMIRMRPDGRSKVELLVLLTQRIRENILADPSDLNSAMKAPNGEPLTFWFRGGTSLIIDPEAGAVTYSVSKSLLSKNRKMRQMAFLRDQIAQTGTAAIARFGLTEPMLPGQRSLEPFALAHTREDKEGTY